MEDSHRIDAFDFPFQAEAANSYTTDLFDEYKADSATSRLLVPLIRLPIIQILSVVTRNLRMNFSRKVKDYRTRLHAWTKFERNWWKTAIWKGSNIPSTKNPRDSMDKIEGWERK